MPNSGNKPPNKGAQTLEEKKNKLIKEVDALFNKETKSIKQEMIIDYLAEKVVELKEKSG